MYTEEQIQNLAPKESAFKAGKKLSVVSKWDSLQQSKRAIWGSIKGSGKKPYLVQIDSTNLAYKCTCPSRQFPCKHALGLLLVKSQNNSAFVETKEPDYVEDWIDRRSKRAEKIDKEEKELSEEEREKRTTAKAKRQDDKLLLTMAGVGELKLWLTDMIRVGILELPNRPKAYFETMMERMVDAKAPGLAGWIKALKNLPYKEQDLWQNQSLGIISKLYLLIKAAEKLQNYNTADKKAIQGLLGWTYTQQELLTDESNLSVKDHWLILGSHTEYQDDLTILRYWLYGLHTQKDALIIRFQNKFTSTKKIPLVHGTVAEAELTFYPGLEPHRAFIKKQKTVVNHIDKKPVGLVSWSDYQEKQMLSTQVNPWHNNHAGIINNISLAKDAQSLVAVDMDNAYQVIADELDEDRISTLLLNAIDKPITMAFVQRLDGILPLGLFIDNEYLVI